MKVPLGLSVEALGLGSGNAMKTAASPFPGSVQREKMWRRETLLFLDLLIGWSGVGLVQLMRAVVR